MLRRPAAVAPRRAARCLIAVVPSLSITWMRPQARSYYHDISDTLVPEGETASRIAQGDPKRRQQVLKEMCLSPVFGARVDCCVLGFHVPPGGRLLQLRKRLPAVIAEVLGLDPSDVALGISRKFVLVNDSFNVNRRVKGPPPGRQIDGSPTPSPTTVIPVHLPDHWSLERQIVLGHRLYATVMAVGPEGVAEHSRRGRLLLSREGGVMHAAPPSLEPESLWDVVAGEAIDADEAEAVAALWAERLARLAVQGDIDDSFQEDRELGDMEREADGLESMLAGRA